MLQAGGSAVDAAVAAGFAAAVAEPGLSSLGGGGFLLVRTPDGDEHLLDFFVDAPGYGLAPDALEPHFVAVPVHFAGAVQEFHTGWGSVAVPGCLDGYLAAHRRWGRLPLEDVVEPARRLALEGVPVDPAQALVIELLQQIFTASPDGRAVVAPAGRLLRAGDRMRNPLLGELLGEVGAGRVTGIADPRLAGPLVEAMRAGGGLVTPADLDAYAVVDREPLAGRHAGARLVTNPPPSFGGGLVAWALGELDRIGGARSRPARAPAEGLAGDASALAAVLVAMSERHRAVAGTTPVTSAGTTHVSTVDAAGGVAAMTTSNGSCSGCYVPGTGIQLNNVMGELDLHPRGFHSTPPGVRIGSMMAPTVVCTPDGGVVGLGSGGSERIRSALACVLHDLLALGTPLEQAVTGPRMHWDRVALQVEPGLDPAVLRRLRGEWPVNEWTVRDLYFGGVNAVARSGAGEVAAAGDPRRGGAALVVDTPPRG